MSTSSSPLLPNSEQRARLRRIRYFKDQFSRYGIMAAGMAVVFSLGLIFFYLFSEVAPLLKGATVDVTQEFSLQSDAENKQVAQINIERYEEIGAIYYQQGDIEFFNVTDGKKTQSYKLVFPENISATAFATSMAMYGETAYGLSNGTFQLIKTDYQISYPQDKRHITPEIAYPLGESPIQLDAKQSAIHQLAIQQTTNGTLVAAATADHRLLLGVFSASKNFITGDVS